MRTRINVTFTAGTRVIKTGIPDLTVEDVRLIVNETQNVIIASSMQKANISVSNGDITYVDTIPALTSNNKLTVEIDDAVNYEKLTAKRLDIADAYTVAEYPVADCTTMAQNHCKAVLGYVLAEGATSPHILRSKVLIKLNTTDAGTYLNLNRNLVFGGSTKLQSFKYNSNTYSVQVPDTGYGYTELWLREVTMQGCQIVISYKHYMKSPVSEGSYDIDTLHPALETTVNGTTTYQTIILSEPPTPTPPVAI